MATTRPAQAAEQSDPLLNPSFRRAWGVPIIIGPDAGGIVSWHAADLPDPLLSPQRKAAERAWRRIARRVAP